MKSYLILAFLPLGVAVALQAQKTELPAPASAEAKAPSEPSAPPAETAPEPETEAASKPEPAPALAPAPPPEPTPAAKPPKNAAKQVPPEDILASSFQTLKSGAEDQNSDLRGAALDDLRVFIQQHPDAEQAPEAFGILARHEEYRPAMVDWLHLVYEYPDSNAALKAKSEYLDLVNKKMSGKLRPGLGTLARSPEAADKAEHLAALIFGLAEKSGDALYDPATAEVRRFQVRFPDYKDNDHILWSLAQLHSASGKNAAALITYRELLSYQGSPYREKSQFAIGALFSEKLKRYRDAVDAFQDFVKQYPESAQVSDALQRLAALYADRLDQAPLAVETYERIIKLFPKTEGALKAFNAEAKLQRERLKQPEEAIKTYERLTEQFHYPQAVEALMNAAEVARKDLKDYKKEVELRSKIAADFPLVKEAPQQLFEAAQVLEEDAQDIAGAVKLYQDVATKFSGTKQGRKAADRANKLLQKKG